MDACPGKRLLSILKFETTAHPTLWSSFEPSVYRNWWSKYLSWTSLKSPWNTNGLVSTFFTVFRPYIINGDSSCQGGDSGMVAWRIVSIFIFADFRIFWSEDSIECWIVWGAPQLYCILQWQSFSASVQWLLICFNIKTFHGRCSKCPKSKPDSLMVYSV